MKEVRGYLDINGKFFERKSDALVSNISIGLHNSLWEESHLYINTDLLTETLKKLLLSNKSALIELLNVTASDL